MRLLFISLIFLVSLPLFAQTAEDCDLKCKSQLLRVTIAPDALKNSDLSPAIPLVEKVLASDKFKNLIRGPFDIPKMSLPHYKDKCLEEKNEGNLDYANIDCDSKTICEQSDLKPEVRRKLCFQLGCTVIAGSSQDQCDDEAQIPFKSVEFPDPLKINDFSFELSKKTEIKDGVLQGCLKVKRLSVEIGAQLNFDPSGTHINDNSIRVQNIKSGFDETASPREVCYKGTVNLGSPNPLQNLTIELQGSDPFISNEMLIASSKDLKISGLSGYSEAEVQSLQGEAYRLFHPVREPIEEGVKVALADVIQETVSETLQKYTLDSKSPSGTTSFVDGRSFMTEIGFHNAEANRLFKELECSQLYHDQTYRLEFDEFKDHPSLAHCRGDESIRISTNEAERRKKLDNLVAFVQENSITSEGLRRKLVNFREIFVNEYAYHTFPQFKPDNFDSNHRKKMEALYDEKVKPIADKIEATIAEKNLPGLIAGVMKEPNLSDGMIFGASIPELCNDVGSSSMANRKMKNCPVQVYIDVKQLNSLLKKLFESGQICESGGGPIWLPRSGGRRSINPNPCQFSSNMGGMSCKLDEAPQLKPKNGKYEVTIKMRGCNRINPLGFFLNKDFDTTVGFTPKACDNGDLCLGDAETKVSFPDGALHLGFKDTVESKIESSIKDAVSGMLKFPLGSAVKGPLANIPLKAQGQVDVAGDAFGICLEPAAGKMSSSGSSQ